MKSTKILSLICISLAGASFAHASFDLVCVLDVTNRKIHRIDGDSGLYLGSINDISIDARTISLDSATGRIYVAEFNYGFSVYDVSTGRLLGTNWNPTPTNGTFGFNNNFLYSNGSQIQSFADVAINPFANSTTFVTLSSAVVPNLTALTRVGNIVYALDNANKRLYQVNATTPSSSSPFLNLVAGVAYSNKMAVDGNYFYQVSTTGVLHSVNSGNFSNVVNYFPTGVGANFTNVTGIVGAHLGTQYVVGTTASGNQVVRTFRNSQGQLFGRKLYTIPGLGSVNDVAVMVAPEPGSMLALGAGLAFLAKRRRKVTA